MPCVPTKIPQVETSLEADVALHLDEDATDVRSRWHDGDQSLRARSVGGVPDPRRVNGPTADVADLAGVRKNGTCRVSHMLDRNWAAWHDRYDDQGSALARRLVEVQRLLGVALDQAPPAGITLISVCAGQGRDVLGVLSNHHRGGDVRALLVEWDKQNVEVARKRAAAFSEVDVRQADAGATDAFIGFVPADVILICGVFGHITDDDIETTISALPGLCAERASVIWTRHRGERDPTPAIREWFEHAGFVEKECATPPGTEFSVGLHRFGGAPHAYESRRMFTFPSYDVATPTPS